MGLLGTTGRASESRRGRLTAITLAAAAAALWVGTKAADSAGTALFVAAVPVFLAVGMLNAGTFGALALPAVFLTYRVGSGPFEMSIADLSLLCALPVALMTIDTSKRPVVSLLRVIVIYQLVLLVVVGAHASTFAVVEWGHRFALMAGGLLIGAATVRLGTVRAALRAFFAVSAVIATSAVITFVTHGFSPAYPLGIHKNAAGSLFAMTIALMATMPLADILPAGAYRPLYLLYGAGLAATRSRGAMVSLAVVFFVLVFVKGARRFRFVTAVGLVAALTFVWSSIQQERRTDINQTQSIGIRERQHAQAWTVFNDHPITGAGIRYFVENEELARQGQPSSILYEVTAESGVVGAADLAFLIGGIFVVLRRLRSPYAVAAMAVFGVKVFHALFDNFWVAGPFTFPWLIMGICAVLAWQDKTESDEEVVPVPATRPLARR